MTKHLKICTDLSAIVLNYRHLQHLSSAEVGAVVKANAYGLGAIPISLALENAGCRTFFVARMQEGVDLRANGVKHTIYVLHGLSKGEEREFIEYNLIPVLNSLPQALLWHQYAISLSQKLQCIIHIDTGMNRLGMSSAEVSCTSDFDGLDVRYIMSHLACADDPLHECNTKQLQKFQSYSHIFPKAKRSFSHSSGAFLSPDYHFDLLRPGAALYGLNPTPYTINPMKNVVSLFAKIMQISDVISDDFVGYGATYKTKAGTKIAVLPIGYSDGYNRHLSNKGFVVVNGSKAPVIGRVSMDLVTIDITGLTCQVGDAVEIIGPHYPADAAAEAAGTIGYEILTSLSRLAERSYLT
jgi:alanine racemase